MTSEFPKTVHVDGGEIELRLMTPSDEKQVLAFAKKLPTHDLLFLPRDITQPKVIAAWVRAIDAGTMTTLLALGRRPRRRLRRHLSRSAFLVTAFRRTARGHHTQRARQGRGPRADPGLLRADVANRHRKNRGPDDDRPARRHRRIRKPRFPQRGLLREHVQDRDGKRHDIVILSHDVRQGAGPDVGLRRGPCVLARKARGSAPGPR